MFCDKIIITFIWKKDHNLAPKWKTIHTPPPPQILKMIKDDTLPFDNIAHDLFMGRGTKWSASGAQDISYSMNDVSDIWADIRTRENTGILV